MYARSGGLRHESCENQSSGILSGRNHSLDCPGAGTITSKWNPRVNEKIGVTDGGIVMRRVSTARPGMLRINAEPAQ